MNTECKNPECPNGHRIVMMCQIGTDYCSQFCEEQGSIPDPKPIVKKRSPRKRTTKKAGAT